jgi:multidrug resistance efflux pump
MLQCSATFARSLTKRRQTSSSLRSSRLRRFLSAFSAGRLVRANIVGIAPRVSGPVIHVAVHDNQEVKKGDLLFEIDPAECRNRFG